MGKNTNIAWTDVSWNISRGCTRVDKDCLYCYMYRDSFNGTRYNPVEVVRTKTVFNLPLKIKEPSRIFTCSLTDFFHEGCDSFRHEAWDIIRQCPQHTFQILTKRPERITACTPADLLQADNIWFGTSVGSPAGMQRIHDLLKVDCKTRFVSFEPLHERIKLNLDLADLMKIHWAIIGGESGNETGKYRYRPCKLEWMEELVKDLTPTTAIFVKQMGTFLAKEMKMTDRHGGNVLEFPGHLQRQEFPVVSTKEKELANWIYWEDVKFYCYDCVQKRLEEINKNKEFAEDINYENGDTCGYYQDYADEDYDVECCKCYKPLFSKVDC